MATGSKTLKDSFLDLQVGGMEIQVNIYIWF